jgi:hypothetical protein
MYVRPGCTRLNPLPWYYVIFLHTQVAVSGSVVVEKLMEVERYSHVMHISSTVTGRLLPQLDSWDALRAALPAGTVSGAPKVCVWSCKISGEYLGVRVWEWGGKGWGGGLGCTHGCPACRDCVRSTKGVWGLTVDRFPLGMLGETRGEDGVQGVTWYVFPDLRVEIAWYSSPAL